MEKDVKKKSFEESSQKEDLSYWLRRTPEEHLVAVEVLRR